MNFFHFSRTLFVKLMWLVVDVEKLSDWVIEDWPMQWEFRGNKVQGLGNHKIGNRSAGWRGQVFTYCSGHMVQLVTNAVKHQL
uniref:Transmembrane protein n=1 Tax=Medicago truncatula TaxID=3880 RepID=Q2HVP3_MEDTR|nr:hypothetical protein MtrDRAFT_AC148815g21v2 [Medicago truncatula]